MAYSNQRAVSDGTLKVLMLTIAFFDKSEITVFVDDAPYPFTWATKTSIEFAETLPQGSTVIVRRNTDISEMRHIFTAGAQFTNKTLDEDYTQILRIAQESVEGAYTKELFNDLDMHGYKVRNMGPATQAGDAVNYEQYKSDKDSVGHAAIQTDRFVGVHPSAPTARRNGAPLQVADEYQNSSDGLRYSWSGTAWVALNSSAQMLETRLASAVGATLVGAALPNGVTGTVYEYMALLEKRSAPSIYDLAHLVTSRPTPANPDTWDWTPAFQASANTGQAVYVPEGLYWCGEVQYTGGWRVHGAGGGRFMLETARTVVRSLSPSTRLFCSASSTFSGQREGGSLFDIRLESDFPFQCGDYTVAVTDGGASPYEMRPHVQRCSFAPITTATGDGIVLVKCFDHVVEGNDITGFARGIVELGSDKGVIRVNRIINFNLFGILQLSTATFGSETAVNDNEFLGGGTGSVYYKTTSRHVRGDNNYFELSGASATAVGFFDASGTDVPQLGPNPVSSTRLSSVSFTRVRNDSKAKARSFVNRLEPMGYYHEITEVGTSGPAATLSWLTIEGGELPLFGNSTNSSMYRFMGGTQSVDTWRTFAQESVEYASGSVRFTNRSLLDLDNSELRRNSAYQFVRIIERGFVLKPGVDISKLFHCILRGSEGVNNPNFRVGVTYNVRVVARARGASASLSVLKIVDAAQQGSTVTAALTNQSTVIATTLTGAAATSKVGVAFHLAGSAGDVVIESVEFSPV